LLTLRQESLAIFKTDPSALPEQRPYPPSPTQPYQQLSLPSHTVLLLENREEKRNWRKRETRDDLEGQRLQQQAW
jgi:hypothetical protein